MNTKHFIPFLLLAASVVLGVVTNGFSADKIQIVRAIEIRGTKNFKERHVRDLIKTRPKDFYSQSAIRDDVEAILASGNYEDASVQTEDLPDNYINLIYTVKERAIIKEITFTGNKKLSKGKIKGEISLKTKSGYDPAKLDADIQKMKQLYAGKGYPDARVEGFTSFDDARHQVNLNFVIDEGNRVLIELVRFDGVKEFSQRKLQKLFKTRRKKVFDQEKLDKDLKELETFYKNNGYASIKVEKTKVEFNADRTMMTIVVPVEEGPRYLVKGFSFHGNTIFKDEDLKKAVEIKVGKEANEERLTRTQQAIHELYLDKGYLYSRVDPSEDKDPEKGEIRYNFYIDEGSVVYIDRVFIEGNKKTKEKVFRREVLLKPGDPFSSSKIRRSQEKIFNLGFIDDVKPDIQPGRSSDKVDLVMDIVEGKPGSLSAGAGYSSTDGLVGQVQLSHSNLFGLAQRLNVIWEFGSRRQNYEVSWTEPWFMDRPISFGLDVFNTVRDRLFNNDSSSDYRETRRGGGVRIGPRFSDIYTLLLSYDIANVQISDVSSAFADQITAGTNLTSSFTSEIIRDTRDFYLDATRGSRNSVSTEFTGGPILQGDINLVKSIVSSSKFWTLFRLGEYPFVFSVNGRGGAVQEYGNTDTVPIYERFFVGGADSVRGYQSSGEIGPSEGGRVFSVFNAEFKVPLYVEGRRRILQFVLFADAGGSWHSAKDVNVEFGQSSNDSKNAKFMKSSVGFGLRITTPVFPIRLDWGYGLNHRSNEDISQIHFTLGNLF